METALRNNKKLARSISIVENELAGYEALLEQLPEQKCPLIGITGAPGAGKSSLVNGFIHALLQQNKKIGIVAVDPTSPFNYGSLLGDRLRMSEHFNNHQVYIRSVATRGSLGGLCEKIVEITDVMRAADFDYVFVETVGVGQSEVEIAGLADITMVVLTPDAGDEVQNMKSGIMEIADILIVNKADKPNAAGYISNLEHFLHDKPLSDWQVPIVPTIAIENKGMEEVIKQMELFLQHPRSQEKQWFLMTEKAYRLIQKKRMHNLSRATLLQNLQVAATNATFNFYTFIKKYY